MTEREMGDWIAEEKERHPRADDETLRRIVEDNLRYDIHYYDRALNRDQRMAADDEDDPFPEHDRRDDKRGGRRHGKPGALVIAFGKPAHDEADPFPEED